MIYNGHANKYAFKHNGCSLSLTLSALPKPPKIKPMKGSEKSLYMSETPVEKAISKSRPLFALLMVESNISEVLKLIHPLALSL